MWRCTPPPTLKSATKESYKLFSVVVSANNTTVHNNPTTMSLPDGEYDIEISADLRLRTEALDRSGSQPSVSYAEPGLEQHLFQLKFTQYPTSLLPDPEFQLFPKKTSSLHFMVASASTNNSKELILEGTALRAKDSEYMLVFNEKTQTLKLCGLNSIIRANKPRSSKKNAQELADLRAYYKQAAPEIVSAKVLTKKTANKWEKFQPKSNSVSLDPPSEDEQPEVDSKPEDNEFDDFDFDNFDQFDDELSNDINNNKTPAPNSDTEETQNQLVLNVATPKVALKKLPTPASVAPTPTVSSTKNDSFNEHDDLDLASFEDEIEDELEDELEQVLGDDDYGTNGGNGQTNKRDGDDDSYFSDFQIEEDPIGAKPNNSTTAKTSKLKAASGPISLRDLVESRRDEDDLSSSEEE